MNNFRRTLTHKADKLFENANIELGKSKCETLEECILFIVDNIVNQLTLIGFLFAYF